MRLLRQFLTVLLFLAASGGAGAQQHELPPTGANGMSTPEGHITGYMSQGDISGLADFVDSTRRLERKDLVSKSLASKRSTVMLTALHIDCKLIDALQIASGKTVVDGKPIAIGLYEAACDNGMGYLLTLVGLSNASGISCFAASATEQGETSDPAKVALKCALPENSNLEGMATTVMRGAGTNCDAHDLKWLGQSADPKLDYTEVTCQGGEGFVLRTPAPGAIARIDVLNCKDAAKHGAACQLSPSPPVVSQPAASPPPSSTTEVRPDLQWFKDALTKRGIACDVKKARIVGRESIKRRYIVEYACPQQAKGLVAYVPSAGDATNPFESIDCPAAALRNISCQFSASTAP